MLDARTAAEVELKDDKQALIVQQTISHTNDVTLF